MAHYMQTGVFMEDLNCSVCLEIFSAPVMLDCGHNFCMSCINKVWDSSKSISCPECREEFSTRKYTVNRYVANHVEKAQRLMLSQKEERTEPEQKGSGLNLNLKEERASQQCVEHGKQLDLFCEEDETLVCSQCIPHHYNHHFKSLPEAVIMFQLLMKTVSMSLESRLKQLQDLQKEQEQTVSTIREQAHSLEQHIRSEFGKLHKFLQDKEEQLIQHLKQDTADILGKMQKNVREIEEKSTSIHQEILHIESTIQQKYSVCFLMEIKGEIERLLQLQEEESASEVTLVKDSLSLGVYNGPLQYVVWKEMRSIINPVPSPVKLDPDTAHRNLILSEDCTSVKYDDKQQQLPENPKRFEYKLNVLGLEGFTSGRHCWEVEVGNKICWNVGVAGESCNRKSRVEMNPENSCWLLRMQNNNLSILGKQIKQTDLNGKIKMVLVYLDFEGGQLSFYNSDDMSHIVTVIDSFSAKLYPIISPCTNNSGKNAEPLKLVQYRL